MDKPSVAELTLLEETTGDGVCGALESRFDTMLETELDSMFDSVFDGGVGAPASVGEVEGSCASVMTSPRVVAWKAPAEPCREMA